MNVLVIGAGGREHALVSNYISRHLLKNFMLFLEMMQ